MGALLDPSDAILLNVASPTEMRFDNPLPLATQVEVMVRAARACLVPLFEIEFPPVRMPHGQSPERATLLVQPLYFLDLEASDWSATALGLDIAKANRTSLIVTGYWLEEAVTFVVLRALSHSYQVYVVLDATPAENSMASDAAWQRLVFAGAVPTTTHQILREWAAMTSDPVCRQTLLALRAA